MRPKKVKDHLHSVSIRESGFGRDYFACAKPGIADTTSEPAIAGGKSFRSAPGNAFWAV
jgi:hypothetical protein